MRSSGEQVVEGIAEGEGVAHTTGLHGELVRGYKQQPPGVYIVGGGGGGGGRRRKV